MSGDLHVDVRFGYTGSFDLDIELSAEQGQITKLVGPSGSGKSTVLSLITGFLSPDQGSITLADKILFSSDTKADVKPWERNVGLLFQFDTLFPHMSVRKNLLYGAKNRTASPWDLKSICELFEIEDLLDRKPRQLSGGQRDRVSLGRTLLAQPEILLLDEPLSSVEASLRERIAEFVFGGVIELKIPTLMVSHDSSLQSFGDGPVYCLNEGKLTSSAGNSHGC